MNNNAVDIALASAGISSEELTELIQAKMAYGNLAEYYRNGWVELPEIARQEGKPIKTPFGVCYAWLLAFKNGKWVIDANGAYGCVVSECSELIPPYDKDGNHIEVGDMISWRGGDPFNVTSIEKTIDGYHFEDKGGDGFWTWSISEACGWTKCEVPDTWDKILEDLRDVWGSDAKDEIIERMERLLENE